MIAHVLIRLAFGKDIQILLDQAPAPAQKKGDLSHLHLLARQLETASEGREVVADRTGAMMRDLADLRHCLAF